jgi:hypothetical protein
MRAPSAFLFCFTNQKSRRHVREWAEAGTMKQFAASFVNISPFPDVLVYTKVFSRCQRYSASCSVSCLKKL